MEGSHHVNWNSIIYRKGAIHKSEIGRSLLAGKGFNTNLVQFLPPYHVISNVHVCSFTCTISHVHGRAPGMVLHARKIIIYEGLISITLENIWKPEFSDVFWGYRNGTKNGLMKSCRKCSSNKICLNYKSWLSKIL